MRILLVLFRAIGKQFFSDKDQGRLTAVRFCIAGTCNYADIYAFLSDAFNRLEGAWGGLWGLLNLHRILFAGFYCFISFVVLRLIGYHLALAFKQHAFSDDKAACFNITAKLAVCSDFKL